MRRSLQASVKTRAPLPGLVLAVLIALVASVCDCKTRHEAAPLDKAVFGAVGPTNGVDAAAYLAVARAALAHAPRPGTAIPDRAGQRVVVTAWAPGRAPAVATALGPTLLASVEAAANEVAKSAPPTARLELDVVTGGELVVLDGELRQPIHELGLYGFVAAEGTAHVGAMSPSETLAYKYFDLDHLKKGEAPITEDRLRNVLAVRSGLDRAALDHASIYRVRTDAWIEPAKEGGAPIALYRSMPLRAAKATPDELVSSVRAGAGYLARVIDAQGRYAYMVHPVDDRPDRSYGLLRHAGSTYALLEAYGETRDPVLLSKAELALAYLASRLTTTPDGSYLGEATDEEQQKVGGAGLAMIAFAKHVEVTGSKANLETMRSLGRFIVHQQYPDGHFRENADVMKEDPAASKKLKKEVSYYAGEATLGLVRLYEQDRVDLWLDAAKRAADYLVFQRDAHDDLDHQIHDHWLSYALLDLYRLTKKDAYAEHAFKIARAILKGEMKGPTAAEPDYLGAFYNQGETTPTSTRLEALAASLELSRFMGKDTTWLEGPAMELACMMRAAQFDPDDSYFLARPEAMQGGVRESLVNSDIRIDYVQHAMSAWLRFGRFLRDPNYGKEGYVAPSGGAADAGADASRPAHDAGR